MISLAVVLAQGIVQEAGNNPNTLKDLEKVFGRFIGVIIPFGGIVLFVMLMYGGIRYISSGANPRNVEAAKNTLTYAIFGIVLLAMAYLILVIIGLLTGADLTTFSVGI